MEQMVCPVASKMSVDHPGGCGFRYCATFAGTPGEADGDREWRWNLFARDLHERRLEPVSDEPSSTRHDPVSGHVYEFYRLQPIEGDE